MDVRTALRKHAAFSLLPEDRLEELSAVSSLLRLKRGSGVWHLGQRATSFVVIAHGLVKLMRASSSQRKVLLGIRGPGECLGDAAAVEGRAYECDAAALTESVVVALVPRREALSALGSSGPAALELARLCAHGATLASRRLALFTAPAEERLAATLMELGSRFGDDLDDGATLIPLRLTRAELAALVGTTVETTIRTLSRWQREGLVTTGGGGLTLHNAEALSRRTSHVLSPLM
ncbi:MAG: Crp/Fnr family transcriptional regulator [Polyangiales bacterium]